MTTDTATSTRSLLGTSVVRREDHRLLTGRGKYLGDLDLRDFYEAAFVRSPHAHARVAHIDVQVAEQLPGVVAVLTGDDIAAIQRPIPPKVSHPDLQERPRLPLARDAVHYVGEPLAVVVASSRYIADDAAELVDVDYETLPAVSSLEEALRERGHLAHEGTTANVAVHLIQRAGNPKDALSKAPHRLAERFVVTRGGGHSMETRGVAARFEPATGELTVWDATQVPHYARNMLAYLYGMDEDDIRLIAPPDVGGGFGPKAQFYGEEAVIPWLAKLLEHPVRWIEDRHENFVSAMMERKQVHHVEVGFDDDGRVIVVKDVFLHDQGAYCAGLQVPSITLSTLPGQYEIPNIHSEVTACYTNMVPTSSVRGAGRPQAVVAMERMMDRVAEHLGLDPAGVRLRNMIKPDQFPYRVGLTFRDGSPLTYDSGDYPAMLRGVLDLVGYETVFAQIAADALELDIDCVRVDTGDTAYIAFGQGTFASRITSTAGPAVHEACTKLRQQILGVAANLLGIDADRLVCRGEWVCLPDDDTKGISLREISQVANVGRHGITLPRGVPAALETSAYFAPERAAYASGTHAAIVDVDPETGGVDIVDYVIGHDCGNVINPLLVDGQVIGGFAHGLGNALYEEPFYDEQAQPQTTSYLDYALPTTLETPAPKLYHLHTATPLNPLGVKGAGEGGAIPVPAAVANAVEDALRSFGARITELPITPAKIVAAIARAEPEGRLSNA